MPAIFTQYIEDADEIVAIDKYLTRPNKTQKRLALELGVTPMTITKLVRRSIANGSGASVLLRDDKAIGTIEARRGPK